MLDQTIEPLRFIRDCHGVGGIEKRRKAVVVLAAHAPLPVKFDKFHASPVDLVDLAKSVY